MVNIEIENLYIQVRLKQCELLNLPQSTFDHMCGVYDLRWCLTIVDEKSWVYARLKYGF